MSEDGIKAQQDLTHRKIVSLLAILVVSFGVLIGLGYWFDSFKTCTLLIGWTVNACRGGLEHPMPVSTDVQDFGFYIALVLLVAAGIKTIRFIQKFI